MKLFKFFLPILSLVFCFLNIASISNYSKGLLLSETIGLSALKTTTLSQEAQELAKTLGYGFGMSSFFYEWQTQQWMEIEHLITQNEVI
ncbi:hypothetical protein [Candidatus Chlamydia sanziniae]|uniref:hypothetical protein n=1 Tax=Candidatus Chlamydia sanziniae TaxID=1806891 RepID=UPI00082F194C|nr:hypothetical protein [Candidatus Chlamydia sanziniae]